jgi:hypothetical protein
MLLFPGQACKEDRSGTPKQGLATRLLGALGYPLFLTAMGYWVAAHPALFAARPKIPSHPPVFLAWKRKTWK